MLVVRNATAYSLDRDSVVLGWEYEDTTESLADYTIAVMRSEAQAGEFEVVSQEMACNEVFEFQDNSVNLYAKWRDYHWRLRVTKTETGTTRTYGSTPYEKVLSESLDPGGIVLEALPDPVAVEASRRFDMVLREFIGRRVLVLPQRTHGTRCGGCWDNLKRRRTTSNCKTCFGSGVQGGYYQPQETFAAKPPHAEMVEVTSMFEMQPLDVLMWFGSRPRLKPRDLVVNTEGFRWRVERVQRSEKNWALTRQTVQLRAISRDQVEYDIPIDPDDWGRNNFSASPPRSYLNSTDIDSYYEGVRELGIVEESE